MKFLIAAIIAVTGGVVAFSVITTNTPTPVDAGYPVFKTPTATRTPTATPTAVPRAEAARDLDMIAATCTSATATGVRAVFLWGPSRGGFQFVDVSIYNDGFAPGTFGSSGPLAPDRWGLVWEPLVQGLTYYARVNTLTTQGWKTTQTIAFFTPICDAAAYYVAPAADMWRLRDSIDTAINGSGIDTAVAITDLRTGETIDVNGDANRLPGCTVNLFALMRVTQDLQFSLYPEAEPGDLIGQTINRSDPITSRTLVKHWLGGGDLGRGLNTVNDYMQSLGMSATLMDHPPAFPGESLYGYPTENRITALDANIGLRALWDGRVLSPGWRDYFLQKMTLVKPGLNYLIPAGTSAGATVSHKNGFLYQEGWADNDIGIVWYQRGGQRYGYAISFFTEGVPVKYADIPLGQRISSLAYQWFVTRYGYP